MKFEIPVLVSQAKGVEPDYTVRPLFHEEPSVSGKLLERVLAKLGSAVRKQLNNLSESARLDALSDFSLCPNYYDKSFQLSFQHKKRTVSGRFLVVVLPELEPRVAFCPHLPSLWFQVDRGENLKARAIEVFDEYFSRGRGAGLSKEHQEHHWVTEVPVSFKVPTRPPKPKKEEDMMILGGPPVQPGWLELERVGRCLDDDHPHDLARCLCRNEEADRLQRAMQQTARAPQLVVGQRKVGKTSLIHEMVRRHCEKKAQPQRRHWLLSPQRLISGMVYVGQWESRLLAILKHAEEKDLILIFDDLLGLFSAGISRDSNLSVADVLKPYLQRGQVRVLAEATQESLSILRERSRGFADLFTVTRLRETTEKETLEIALEEMREGERLHSCEFDLEALSTSIDLQRRYVKDSVFPGKSAVFLRKVAARCRGEAVTRQSILDYFHAVSGMSLQLLDDQVKLSREDVLKTLSGQVMGQTLAVEAAADAVMMSKARLCDPGRPLASLLFVGPTGVGKTECAKALARYLFGDAERLLRFDMNEFVNPHSASRLVGTFHQPDGLLTSAVRRRPFCVLLLDEIEKAHPEVFNLLLQVLGDGRLTDARGRTVDFSQTIVVLTSNLGVREASKILGFRSKSAEEGLTYRRAAEQFFAPEFFNRLDKVVPFSRLSRDDTAILADRLIKKVLAREGLVRRQCLLQVDGDAMREIVEMGFHPQLGARALKRSVEKLISAPVAARLTEMRPNAPTVIRIRAEDGLKVEVTELQSAPLVTDCRFLDLSKEYLDEVEAHLQQREEELAAPEGLVSENMSVEQYWYYAVQDRIRCARAIARRLRDFLTRGVPKGRNRGSAHNLLQPPEWTGLLGNSNLVEAMKELLESLPTSTETRELQGHFVELCSELALVKGAGEEQEAVLELRFQPAAAECAKFLAERYRYLAEELEFEFSEDSGETESTLKFFGPETRRIAAAEQGLHLFIDSGSLLLVAIGESTRVVRIYDKIRGSIDLRTGWMCSGLLSLDDMKYLILTGVAR